MMKRLLSLLLAVMMLVSTGVACAAEPREIFPLEYDQLPEPRPGQHHYLLACIDNWHSENQKLSNTDGVILVTLDTEAKRVLLTTFTREMLIKRPDGGTGRITYIAKNYGPEALCEIISTHFGVKVDKYIIFSMDNVQSIIDEMGGVEITVTDAEADYLNRYRISRDSTTPSMGKGGTYLFGGHAAVIYMRIRKVGGDGDAGRTRRMRTVLSTLAKKYENASLGDALALLSTVSENLIMMNLTTEDLVQAAGYAMELRGVTPEGMQMPSDAALTDIVFAGMQTREVDFEMAREELAQFLGLSPDLETQQYEVGE
ncbi:MAG: LCP family protein [Clostridia bacterium]|nr:LCP family protein [Clostridia bacterium]